MKEAKKKQQCCRRIAKSDSKIKITWSVVRNNTGKVHQTKQMPFCIRYKKKS